jgi:site-specific DNA-cytosine methylase
MKVLVACEYSGVVRDAFLRRGHSAVSCDLLSCESLNSGDHYQCDVRNLLDHEWDLMIAHPPCTYLSVSGMHRTTRGLRDPQLTEDALDFVRLLMGADIPRIAIENPVSVISTRIRKPDQIIQPWQFGHDASKKTCLWLSNLPTLTPTQIVEPRIVNGRQRWANQTDSGQNRLPPSEDRWKIRSATYQGIADAMADQWGSL